MVAFLNKKVLCFLDEYGTAGAGPLHLGAAVVLARDAGRTDKCFSDLLEANVNEVHAVSLDDTYLQGLMQCFWLAVPQDKLVMINQKIPSRGGEAPMIYADAVIQTVKTALKRFQKDVLGREAIGIVEVIIDANHHNEHPVFTAAIEQARLRDGRFRGVKQVARIDSAVSRLLQLADVVAYARKWIVAEDMKADGLRRRFGIHVS